MLREGVDPTIIPTPAFRGVYQWATNYYRDGGGIAPTPEVMIERWGIDFWADHQIAITDDPQETVEWAIEDLKQTFIQKEIGSFAKKLATEVATATPEERTATAAALSSELSSLVQSIQSRITQVDIRDSGTEMLAEYNMVAQNLGIVRGMALGLEQIDTHLGGIWEGELAVVAGPSGTGKSWVANWVALKEWNRDRRTILFTLENSIGMTQARIGAMALNLDAGEIQRGTLSPEDYERYRDWCSDTLENTDNPLYIASPTPALRTPEAVLQMARAYDCESVIIDQLTFLNPSKRSDQRHREIATMLHALKEGIGGRDPMSLLLMHQVSRDGVRAAAASGRLQAHHMADGAEVERTADHLISLYQGDENREMGRMELQGLKHRRVEPRSFSAVWQPWVGVISVLNEIDFDE